MARDALPNLCRAVARSARGQRIEHDCSAQSPPWPARRVGYWRYWARGRAGPGRQRACWPIPRGDLIAGGSQIAKDQIVFRIFRIDEGFEPAIVLRAIGQRITENGDMIT